MGFLDRNVGEKCQLDKAMKDYRMRGGNMPPMEEMKSEYCSPCKEACHNNKSA
jgi:hypothetical protein